ncbi:hypothetical protein HanXRQr2_Chr05g0212231 [Helianthus annuus]|uniref:Uncharacterized protein n=1 Tax=Helianthus annuus TaxID=4232 RepID=A0A9K3NNI3_HELAN|nr:hypothetical protein HanXRQr2_Chr05g0212231 [Helianthus annuus]
MNNGITIRSTQRSHKEYGIIKLHLQNGLSCPWHGPCLKPNHASHLVVVSPIPPSLLATYLLKFRRRYIPKKIHHA